MLEILGGTSDGDLLEAVICIHPYMHYIYKIPPKLTLHVFLVNIVTTPQKKKNQMNEYVLNCAEANDKIAFLSVKILC